ncbi:MAG: formate dehydrogenase subunit gamma [Dehalococcoidia bacterium]
MTTTSTWDEERALALIRERQHLPGALLPMLHALQEEFGYVSSDALPLLADALNISRAEVVGVVRFYHDFKEEPGGRHVLKVCRAESCQSMGCDDLVGHIERSLGIELGETTNDGALTVEAVYCLGNCALSPAAMLDNRLYGRVNAAKADRLIAQARSSS